jgi:hypothetical protein
MANREHRDLLTFEIRQAALQLDELRFAKWSPTGAPVKHDQGSTAASGLMDLDGIAMLVW